MSSLRAKLRPAVTFAACASLALVGAGSAAAQPSPVNPKLPHVLTKRVGIKKIDRHLAALQGIAEASDGNRAAGSEGHARSAEYVAKRLEHAGFDVTRQEFQFSYFQTLAQRLEAGGSETPIIMMSYSPSTPEGGITAPLAVVTPDDTPGCEASDFGDVTGQIALIKRGSCTFAQKQASAAEAGAVGAIIYNNEEGALNGTLGDPDAGRIPTGGISLADGETLAGQDGVDVTLELRADQEERTTYNVVAQTQTGREDNVVMAGAHLDGVPAGPGINDNGSGSAALLETALQLGAKPKVNNAVRFAWWSAEEFGLLGSTHYVDSLTPEQQSDIALYLNFDMIGSPNAGYFVYDGDDSDGVGAGPGPEGSAEIEKAFVGYLEDERGVPTEGTDFDGRSDYGEFIAVGIPSGGLFTGAEDIMTDEQAQKWGGEAGIAYDPCYHQACDDLDNVDRVALDRNADAMAWVIGTFALSTENVNGVAPGSTTGAAHVTGRRDAAAHGHSAAA
jgi:Zn-dependent M28 family amino/carboxypeptidase